MKCIDCQKREGPTPNAKRCGACCVKNFYKKNPEWRKSRIYGGMRNKVIEKYQNKCGVCFIQKQKMQIHHIDGKGSSLPVSKQNNILENLMLVCTKCHNTLEKPKRQNVGAKKITTWAKKYIVCIICQKKDNKHLGRGMCTYCYQKKLRTEYKRIYWQKHYGSKKILDK